MKKSVTINVISINTIFLIIWVLCCYTVIIWIVITAVVEKFKASANFFKNAKLAISFEGKLDSVNNYCIAVKEKGDDIVFLRKIVKDGLTITKRRLLNGSGNIMIKPSTWLIIIRRRECISMSKEIVR